MNDAHSAPYGSGRPANGQDPHGQDQDPYARDAYGRDAWGRYPDGSYAQEPYPAEDPYGQGAYTQQPYDPATGYGTGNTAPRQAPPQQPVYDPYAQPQAPYDPYGGRQQPYDPYGQQQQPQQPPQQPSPPQQQRQPQPPPPQQQAPAQGGYGYDAYGDTYAGQQARPQPYTSQPYDTQQQPPVTLRPDEQGWVPQQRPPQTPAEAPGGRAVRPPDGRPTRGPGGRDSQYAPDEFSFIEEPDEDSEDVIDWLKFAETRSERRDERKRKYRHRVVGLVVVLVLAVTGGVGYLWYAGKIPGMAGVGAGAEAAPGEQKRDVIVVHLRDTKGRGSATALLVANETTGKGTTVLLPNSLSVSTEDGGGTTLGKSVEDAGTQPTREAIGTLLGSDIKGSWRLDTPYLENLVELVGGITLDTDADVPGAKKGDDPLARRGKAQDLNGRAAVGYATLSLPGEEQTRQLQRFGQVMQAVLRKMSSDVKGATTTVQSLSQIPDPSLSESQLGALLARLAEQAKGGEYRTKLLPVQPDGRLSEQATENVVKNVLGGAVKNTDPDAVPRISVQNATGDEHATTTARAALVNGGYTFVDGGPARTAEPVSRVSYADTAQRAKAEEAAKTLGLPVSVVKKGRVAANADVTIVLGRDYDGSGTG